MTFNVKNEQSQNGRQLLLAESNGYIALNIRGAKSVAYRGEQLNLWGRTDRMFEIYYRNGDSTLLTEEQLLSMIVAEKGESK